jgi:spermidine synthase
MVEVRAHNTPDGRLCLLQRGDNDFIIKIGNQVLMNSQLNLSEIVLATSACQRLADRPAPLVMVSGLGMGYTLRAALDTLPADAVVTVVELNRVIVEWCRGPLAPLTNNVLDDPRVRLVEGDAAQFIRDTARAKTALFDAIILDMYEGTGEANQDEDHPFFGFNALRTTKGAIKKDGVFSVWTEGEDKLFVGRLKKAGFQVEAVQPRKGGPRHVVYLSTPKIPQNTPPKTPGKAPKKA